MRETWVWSLGWEDSLEKGKEKYCPLQYSDLENCMDCIVHGVAKSQTWLSDFHFHILPASWEICMQVKKQQLEVDMKQQIGSK